MNMTADRVTKDKDEGSVFTATSAETFNTLDSSFTKTSVSSLSPHPQRPKSSRIRAKRMSVEIDDILDRQEDKKENKNIAELTINKLRIEKVGMVGREKEQETLERCFEKLTKQEDESTKDLIFIKGYSGSGKSKLARTLYQISKTHEKLIIAEGKFESSSDEPYSGVADAFESICHSLKSLKDSESGAQDTPIDIHGLGTRIVEELGASVDLMARLIPSLTNILPSDAIVGDKTSFIDIYNFEAAQEQIKYAFRVLTLAICSYFNGVVLILDDLQWADVASLDVIDYLISDKRNQGLMIIGTYRSNEVDDNHILFNKIQTLQGKQERNGFEITQIELRPFSVDSVNEIIMRLLSIDDKDSTLSLAELCLKRTLGNPYFVIEYLKMLKDEGLLDFSIGLLQWKWDSKEIENTTFSTDNVADLLKSRMGKLSGDEQLLLQYAACLGSSFSMDTVNIVWKNHATQYSDHRLENADILLKKLEEENYIERGRDDKYQWVHDKVQEAALSMEEARKSSFQFEIGLLLYKTFDAKDLDASIFDVADLINRGNAKRQPELAQLNLIAAEKARQLSAFHTAFSYVLHGIGLLPNTRWKDHRPMTLQLYTMGAQMALAASDFDKMEEYSQEILSQGNCTAVEKFPLHMTQLQKLSMELKYDEAITFSLQVLKELGCDLIPNRTFLPVYAVVSLLKTLRTAKKLPRNFYKTQKLVSDPRLEAISAVVGRLGYMAYLTNKEMMFVQTITYGVQMSIDHGIHEESGTGFATLGVMARTVLGDYVTAASFAETARKVQRRAKNQYATCGTDFAAHYFTISWTEPLQSCLTPFLDCFKIGMRTGSNDYATWSLLAHKIHLPYQIGKPIPTILDSCPEFRNRVEELNQKDQSFYARLYWQLMLNLSGQAKDPMKLKGIQFDCDSEELSLPQHSSTVNFCHLGLYLFYGNYEKAAKHALECGDTFEKVTSSMYLTMMETFQRCLSLYAWSRRSHKRKYRKHAKRVHRKIGEWLKKGCPNVVHYHALLDAEEAALNKNYKKAESLYQKAIVLAARPGYLHDAALFNERYADFLSQEGSYFKMTGDDAQFRLREAVRYYDEWGATSKAEMLRQQFA